MKVLRVVGGGGGHEISDPPDGNVVECNNAPTKISTHR